MSTNIHHHQPHPTINKIITPIIIIHLFLASVNCTVCGNSIFEDYPQSCDDGNQLNSDGCNSNCQIQLNYDCSNITNQQSICKSNTTVTLLFLGAMRNTEQNSGILYFSLLPYNSKYQNINFNGLFITDLQHHFITAQYFPISNTLKIAIQYFYNIQSTIHNFNLHLNSTNHFKYSTASTPTLLTGSNCQLTYDQQLWLHNSLRWVYVVIVCLAVGIFVVCCLKWQKWIGLEIIQTLQAVYFVFGMLEIHPYQFSAVVEYLKFSNGLSYVFRDSFERTNTLTPNLTSLAIDKQFWQNYNIIFCCIGAVLLILIGISLYRRHFLIEIKQEQKQQIRIVFNDKIKHASKIYSTLFSKIFIMLILFSMFQVIFCFFVQIGTQSSVFQLISQQTNITLAIISFFTVFGVLIYFTIRFYLLPQNAAQHQFMSIHFISIQNYYPILYLTYQSLWIVIISVGYHYSITQYILLGLQILYFIVLIVIRPYNIIFKANRIMQKTSIIFNQSVVMLVTVICIRCNQIANIQIGNRSNELKVYALIIPILLFLAIVLTIIRLFYFSKNEVCLRQNQNQIKQMDFQSMKNMNAEYNSFKISLMKCRPMKIMQIIGQNQLQNKQHQNQSSIKQQPISRDIQQSNYKQQTRLLLQRYITLVTSKQPISAQKAQFHNDLYEV